MQVQISDAKAKFEATCPENVEKEATQTLHEAAVTFASGLSFQHFAEATDKTSLRANVLNVVALLNSKGLTKDQLCPALRVRIDQAIAFKLAA